MRLNYAPFEQKMKKSISALEENLDTIRASQANPAVLAKITARITAEVEGINRVLMDLTPKPVGTIEWE